MILLALSFENPQVLGWIGLVLLVALLALRRRRAVRVEVPSVLLWREIQDMGGFRSRRWWEWLSLLLQIGVIVSLVTAWAGPRVGGGGAGGQSGPGRLVLVLDLSPSMGARDSLQSETRLEKALQRVRVLARSALPGERVTLVGTAPRFRVIGRDLEVVGDVTAALEGLSPSEETGVSPQGVVDLVRRLHEGEPFRLRVLTDLAGPWAAALVREPDVQIEFFGQATPNDALRVVRASRMRDRSGVNLLVEVFSCGGAPRNRHLLVRVDGEVRARRELRLVPGEEVVQAMVPFEPGDARSVEVLLSPPDALTADDHYRVELAPVRSVPVVLVGEGEVDLAVRAALDALGKRVDRDRSRRVPLGTLIETDPDWPELVLVLGSQAVLPSGPAVAFFLHPDALRRRLGIDSPEVESPRRPVRVMAGESWMGAANLDDLVVRRHVSVESSGELRVVVETVDGSPLLLAEDAPGRLHVYLAFHLSESNLSALAAFPLLLDGLLEAAWRQAAERVIEPSGRDSQECRLWPRVEPPEVSPFEPRVLRRNDPRIDLRPFLLILGIVLLLAEMGLQAISGIRRKR